jgi:hypothetical protein
MPPPQQRERTMSVDRMPIEAVTRQVLERIHEAELALMHHVEAAQLEAIRRRDLTESVETLVDAFEELRPTAAGR